MAKGMRCMNFPFFSIFGTSTPPDTGRDLPAQSRFYDRLFRRNDSHTSGYDMLQDEHDAHYIPQARTHNTAVDDQNVY